jgi:conjugal transfer ATP-binding protein TraC
MSATIATAPVPQQGMIGKVMAALRARPPKLVIQSSDERVPRTGPGNPLPFDNFSSLLPVFAFDAETQLFLIKGAKEGELEGVGFTIEIAPAIGADRGMAERLATLFQGNLPSGTGMQFQIFGLPYLEEVTSLMRAYSISETDILKATNALAEYEKALDVAARQRQELDMKTWLAAQPRYASVVKRVDQVRVLRSIVERRIAHYERCARQDVYPGLNNRMRTYRANMSVVIPGGKFDDPLIRAAVDARNGLKTLLTQYGMFDFNWQPQDYIAWTRMILNPQRLLAPIGSPSGLPPVEYDDGKPINQQIVLPDTHITIDQSSMMFQSQDLAPAGARYMSVASYPRVFGLHHMLNLLGSDTIGGLGYPCPFLITMGVGIPDYDRTRTTIAAKAARAQQTADSKISRYMPGSAEVNEDYKIAQLAYENGSGICRLYHQVAVFAAVDQLPRAEQSARSVFNAERFSLGVDGKMQLQACFASMPMMFGPLLQNDMKLASRVSFKTFWNAANLLPVLAEWRGTPRRDGEQYRRPVLTFTGRRGQLFPVDLFANPAGNYNSLVIGAPGSGKSFLVNELIQRTLDQGGRVWVIDIGRSYEKFAKMLGGQYIEFVRSRRLSLNPFSLLSQLERSWQQANDKDEDNSIEKEIAVFVVPMLAQAISPSAKLDDWRLSELQMHAHQLYLDKGESADLDQLAQYLIANCEQGGSQLTSGYSGNQELNEEQQANLRRGPRGQTFDPTKCDPEIRKLGQQLAAFAGANGEYFKGVSNVEFNSNFVVLELEELNDNPPLRDAVLQMLMYRISAEMYRGSRKTPKLVLIDEAWQLLNAGAGSTGKWIEGGFRKARKYNGSFTVCTHSVLDLANSETGAAAMQAADWMFLMRQNSSSIDALMQSGKLKLDEYTERLLRSVTTVQGQYSEAFIRCEAFPPSVGRLFVDQFSLIAASSRAQDFEEVRAYIAKGLPIEEAIEQVAASRASARDKMLDA